jgi:hypothetical protein
MPDPRQAPKSGYWVDRDLGELHAGTYLPAPLDVTVMRRLSLLDRYAGPKGICQQHLNAQAALHARKLELQAGVQEAHCIAQRIEQSVELEESKHRPNLFQIVAIVGTLVTGIAIGYGARAAGD